MLKNLIKNFGPIKKTLDKFNSLHARTLFVSEALSDLAPGAELLDAGCGSQQFRRYCAHLSYKGQDFGQYKADQKNMFESENNIRSEIGYQYGNLDYIGNIWEIKEKSAHFDAILCTEVFEHITYPIDTVGEFARLLKSGGKLILTVPSNCLRHMDPFFYYSGFSDRWLETILGENGFSIDRIDSVGDYYSWMAGELWRTIRTHSIFIFPLVLPALVYFMVKKPTEISTNTLVGGYHVIATKK
jgi:SAM-dependent methyltransferase